MPVIPVSSLEDPRLRDYCDIKDADLVKKRGIFIVESPLTVRRFAEGSRFALRSVFLSERQTELITHLGAVLPADKPIYTATPALMSEVVGLPIHRACLAVGECGPELGLPALLEADTSGLVVVMEALSNAENVGSIFRNAAAFGVGAVVLDGSTCDPLYRRSIRVSVGTALTVPFTRVSSVLDALDTLRAAGYLTLALTPDASASTLAAVAGGLSAKGKVAVFVGAEGPGLTEAVLREADLRARIPMSSGVDSINVAAAAAVAFYRLQEARVPELGR